MFRLTDPPVVITQNEHARLAGLMAAHWGNGSFDRPALPFGSFVAGVTFHDWHYGLLDEFPLDDLDGVARPSGWENQWLAIHQRGAAHRFDDPVTDVVVKMHIRRLVDDATAPGVEDLKEHLDGYIAARIKESGFSHEQFEWADRLTAICDLLAFDLFRQGRNQRTLPVLHKSGSTEEQSIECATETAKRISLKPWPFDQSEIRATVLGFAREGYPKRLEPNLVQLEIVRAK